MDEIANKGMKHCLRQFLAYANETLTKYCARIMFDGSTLANKKPLYLTHGRFGENRERGLAFVKLKMEFAKAGFYIKNDELPDYLPLILEFASIADKTLFKKCF
ncbi:hypothetical protein P7F88_10845 [Vibrio hannami]|nr:hypothetical protein [Vibrio hannami]MDG3086584.1 hypothetical protein [Vibrio hannami]